MWLKILHKLGLTNLTNDEVQRYEDKHGCCAHLAIGGVYVCQLRAGHWGKHMTWGHHGEGENYIAYNISWVGDARKSDIYNKEDE